jgi:hypothetical protein
MNYDIPIAYTCAYSVPPLNIVWGELFQSGIGRLDAPRRLVFVQVRPDI